MILRRRLSVNLAFLLIAVSACLPPAATLSVAAEATTVAATASETAAASKPIAPTKVRNVILMIGDGMGPQEVGLLTLYARYAPHSIYADRVAAIERLYNESVLGLVRPEPHGMLIVDSAAASTQLASGQIAGSEMIGVDFLGRRTKTICEVAKELGKSAGLVTDTRVTHATPAGFAAHQRHRLMENEIAVDMLGSQVDVMLGGGLRHWIPQSAGDPKSTAHAAVDQMVGGRFSFSSKRTDERNVLLEARQHYQLIFDHPSLHDVKSGPVLGIFADSEMDDSLLEQAKLADPSKRTQPSLVEMSTKALDLLDQNPKGFFAMIEGGQIDWCGHNNDAGTLLHELIRFDNAVRAVRQWIGDRDDTLLLVTADHETGGFGFSYAGRPQAVATRLTGEAFGDAPYQPNFNYAPVELLDKLYAQKKSFFTVMFGEFDLLPEKEKTPEKLVELVNAASEFKISLQDATEVLTRAPNGNYVPGHPFTGTQTVPQIRDYDAFYVYGENLRMDLLGRKLATQQHITWGAGTHTSTPIVISAFGPNAATQRFGGMIHATDVGQRMIELLGGPAAAVESAPRTASDGK